jgi:hypothetical protein
LGRILEAIWNSNNPSKLKAWTSVHRCFTALENNNGIAGGAYIEKWIKVILSVQKEVKSLDDIENIVVKNGTEHLFMWKCGWCPLWSCEPFWRHHW